MPSLTVSHQLVGSRKGLEVCHTAQDAGNDSQSLHHVGPRYVLEHVRADDQVVRAAQPHPAQVTHSAEPDVARAAIALHHVFAGVDTEIVQLRPDPAQLRSPRTLATAYVQDGADLTAEDVLRCAECEPNLPPYDLGAYDSLR